MFIGPEDGCQDVPDPIAPIDIRFLSLDPTRIAMSLSVITNNGPMFIGPILCLFPIPGIFIPGMFMPGILAMSCFFGFLFLVEVLLPFGVDERDRFDPADGDGFRAGIFMPGISCDLT